MIRLFRPVLALICLGLFAMPALAVTLDTEKLADKIAKSIAQVANPKYATVAFSRIQGGLDLETKNELIDFTNVSIVRSRSFRVVDRSKLNLIIAEQKFNLSGMVSQDTYKELGKLLGVDLFIYGRFYKDVLVMKAIDTERSTLVWSEIFQLTELTPQTVAISQLASQFSDSLKKDAKRLKSSKIGQLSFWNIASPFDGDLMVDFLSAALTKDGNFQVVDRENLALILEEQKLSMSDFIDEQKAKKMGELYGVDGFIYGNITQKRGQWVASFKLLNIYSGVIEWADLLRFGEEQSDDRKPVATQVSQSNLEMALVPAGEFIMGSDEGDLVSAPKFRMQLGSFLIDKTEVSNSAYAAYTQRFQHRTPPHWQNGMVPKGQEDWPVVNVNWQDAKRYCQTEGKRLPTESEWEKAYRGTNGNTYPWPGSQFDRDAARTVESGVLNPMGVDESNSDISSFGAKHMAGNVREWTESTLLPYPNSNYRNPKMGREKVIRGGSWAEVQAAAVGWMRGSSDEKFAWKDVGFRCAKDAF
ncbi:MAG: hypothetical protein A2600_08350 [Candidatus Lambdaproteobacteria bacterium RIFOXYD1_FULL_56_27]|uniref:Sulfatase-modifying factor enzyme-like domain-containing protein n=1 Tax=Candidatus Lambdaproteobacteria bacterium RIFOXYD2_FULL_56_26 TaxID=1817773 RepID=A0A1F6H069_9PROT|nr:MAG: hypothetical protein A2426_06730 [Candidatus Lambdaproteobacteria bacterium RIFOXYC1_FULL_56_13]OGH03795.1 MAG: hypothetical protein A2557_13675 [Candidatus Lambdaproteobacteria bacterium RIFOXYD2_FULL_56_26]OGH08790.1 MAG: hypothetical protein A2600_08350 [Candidatus Lambdaproteobacteria bacterium RIFOXYD1_FULL_56_27]